MLDQQSHSNANRPRLLLVDDTELNRDIIGRILSAAGFDVDFACDGEAAYEATWGKTYDLVLMDVEMPGMNGFETAARIRGREGAMAGVKIAALTATAQPHAEHYSFWSGIDAFIAKPIAPAALVARVTQIIADLSADSRTWKPVWRLSAFTSFTERLDAQETEAYLDDYVALSTSVAQAINVNAPVTAKFAYDLRKLLDLSSHLGFDEVAGICKLLNSTDGRNRRPNLLGAIDRAQFAIAKYVQEHCATRVGALLARTMSGMQSLLRNGSSAA